jgi:hypothetical protein
MVIASRGSSLLSPPDFCTFDVYLLIAFDNRGVQFGASHSQSDSPCNAPP